jgi:hypothetical protein
MARARLPAILMSTANRTIVRELYTMLTRGRAINHFYLQVVGDGDPHTLIRPETVAPRTMRASLKELPCGTRWD